MLLDKKLKYWICLRCANCGLIGWIQLKSWSILRWIKCIDLIVIMQILNLSTEVDIDCYNSLLRLILAKLVQMFQVLLCTWLNLSQCSFSISKYTWYPRPKQRTCVTGFWKKNHLNGFMFRNRTRCGALVYLKWFIFHW